MNIANFSSLDLNKMQDILKRVQPHYVIPQIFLKSHPFVFDFTKENKILSKIDLHDTRASSKYINDVLGKAGQRLGIGKYGEDRTIYRSSLYTSRGEARSVHLAIDLFVPSGTPIFSPFNGIIHSFQDNNNFLDYGPTIITKHSLKDIKFYILYGHLSRSSLKK